MSAIAGATDLGLYVRNVALYGSPFGSVDTIIINADFGLGPLTLNAIRNIAVNFATFSQTINQLITTSAVDLIRALKLIRTIQQQLIQGQRHLELVPWQNSDAYAGNPLHLILIAIAIAASIPSDIAIGASWLWGYCARCSNAVHNYAEMAALDHATPDAPVRAWRSHGGLPIHPAKTRAVCCCSCSLACHFRRYPRC